MTILDVIKRLPLAKRAFRLARRIPLIESTYRRITPLELLVVTLGTKCSLRCRDCGNFIPRAEQVLYDWREVVADLRLVVSAAGRLRVLQIQGGEPLLHPELPAVLREARSLPIGEIVVATNGMHLLAPEALAAIRATGAALRISNYAAVDRARERTGQLVLQLLKERIAHTVFHFASRRDTWLDLGDFTTPTEIDDQKVRRRFLGCPFQRCFTIENGLLGRCARSTLACLLGQVDFDTGSLVAVRRLREENPSDAQRSVRAYLGQHRFMTACRRCNGGEGASIPAAIQLTGPAGERLRLRQIF